MRIGIGLVLFGFMTAVLLCAAERLYLVNGTAYRSWLATRSVPVSEIRPHFLSRDIGTVQKIDRHGNLTLIMDDGQRSVSFNVANWRHIDYQYTITSFSIESKTTENILIDVNTLDSRHLLDRAFLNVAVSRGSHRAVLFRDNKQELLPALDRIALKPMALSPEQIEQYRSSAEKALRITPQREEQTVSYGIGI
jgi:hypothetical protein